MSTKPKNIRELAKGKGKRDIWYLDPRVLKMKKGWNERDERPELKDHIQGIADSIFATGYDAAEPMIVYPEDGEYFISDGHCRLRGTMLAIKMGADIESVPVITEAAGVGEADRVAGMITRNSGLNLTPLEIGRVCQRLSGFGWTEQRIADKIGKKLPYVKSVLTLMEGTPKTHAQVIAGEVSPTVATIAVREHGPARAEKILDRAVKASAGKRATARDVKAAENGEAPVKPMVMSELMEFFATTIREADGPPIAILVAEAIIDLRERRLTGPAFMKRLNSLSMVAEEVA